MSIWERNYNRESQKAKQDTLEWWSLSTRLFGLHVYSKNGSGWRWKINSVSTIESTRAFPTKEEAMSNCLHVARVSIAASLAVLDNLPQPA